VVLVSTPAHKFFLHTRDDPDLWSSWRSLVAAKGGQKLLLPVLLLVADLFEFLLVTWLQHRWAVDGPHLKAHLYRLGNNTYFRFLCLFAVMHNVCDPFFTMHSRLFCDSDG
jgi:hypothetical protein